jgi:hypothetical protein
VGRALAHGLGGRSDLPVPIWLAQYGAAVARALGLALAAVTVAAAALGPDDPVANPAPTWLYVWFWVGLVPASLAFGPVWRLLNPLRTLSAALERLRGRGAGEAREPPAWLGYGLVHLGASMVYGQAWFARGDGFEVYSTLLASLCPFGRRDDGRLVVRNPLAGLAAAVGYTLAHYFSLLVLEGQNGSIRASDPFGRGWDLFGTAGWVQNPQAVSTATIALVQVSAIVGGIALLVGT